MPSTLVYMVCDQANLDVTTGVCTQVQYVQAPLLLPPIDSAGGVAIALAIIGVWAVAAVYRSL
jgi:hypothetical protein